MADLKISELSALAGANLAAGDLFAAVDVSASETKKITVQDAIGYGVTLIADATIPGAKILFNAASISGDRLTNASVGATQLAADAVTGVKLADNSSCRLVTTLPASGDYVGQLALDTDDNNLFVWNGSAWTGFSSTGTLNSVVGSTAGVINIVVTNVGDQATISATLDNTSAAAQFLAGPTANAGAVAYRTIAGDDLPTATSGAKGGVAVNGEGLRMDGTRLEIDNDLTASGGTYSLVDYSAKGLVIAGRAIISSDMPAATGGARGAVLPGSGLSVDGSGTLNHTNSAAAGTYTKITIDAQGHVTTGTTLADTDIPNLPAGKLTSGTISASVLGTNSITGAKLANYATVKFGGAGSTSGVVTFPTPDFAGQQFFDATNGDLYLYDGNTWQPITVISGDLVYAGTYNAATNRVKSVTTQGSAAGLVVGAVLPAASSTNIRYYVVVSDSGTGVSPAPAVALAPPDMIISNGATWDLVDVSNAIAGQIASNIAFTPYGDLAANNVQTALQELDDEKLSKAGGTVTGNLEIGSSGSLTFEGSSADASETTLAVTNPTADRTITLPDATGTVVLSGAIVNADINASAAIVDTKLATISTAGKVANSATTATSSSTANAIVARDASGNFNAGTISAAFSGNGSALTSLTAGNLSGTIPSAVLANSSLFLGTTSVALNRSSANQALTGISSVAMPGSTSGSLTIQPAAAAGTNTLTFPAVTGTVVTTGDTGSVTNTMLAGSIADTKLSTISTAGKVANSATTATDANTASAIVARDASGNFSAGTITAALTGNASTATTLATARNIQGVSFNGSANITVVTAGSGISVTGTAVANTGVLSVNGSAGAITNVAVTNAAQSFSAAQRGTISALTDGATITPDFAAANNFSVTLAGNRTLANPTNLTAGQSGCIWITQDATGSRTLAYGSQWDFSGGTAPTLTTAANARDCIVYAVQSSTQITATLITNLS
jgi:hypothetical protein